MDEYIENKISKTKILFLVITSLLILIAIFYFFYWRVPTIDYKDLKLSELETQAYSSEIKANGSFRNSSERVVTAEVSGTIVEIFVDVSEKVKIGKILVVMASGEIEKKNQEYSLELLKARTELDKLLYDYKLELLLLESKLKKSKTELDVKAAELASLEKIKDKGIISTFQYNAEVGNLEKLRVDYEINQIQYNSHRTEAKSYIDDRQKIYEQQKEIVQLLKQDYESLTISSPLDGIILSINNKYKIGDLVQKGAVLMTIGSIYDLDVILRVPASQASSISSGAVVNIEVGNELLNGQIRSISPTVVNQFVEVLVDINEDLPTSVRSDQSLVASIKTAKSKTGLVVQIPDYIKQPSVGLNYVYVFDESIKRLVKKEISIIKVNEETVVIGSDQLGKGEKVLISNHEVLSENEIEVRGH